MSDTEEQRRSTKRKRGPAKATDDLGVTIRCKLHHGYKEVKKSSKKAKTFETQKLVKRLKGYRKDGRGEDEKAAELQLECLKLIDCERIAAMALLSKIKKDHMLWVNGDVNSAVKLELPNVDSSMTSARSTHSSTVESRLLSSKIVSQEISSVIQALRDVINVKNQKKSEAAEEPVAALVNRERKTKKSAVTSANVEENRDEEHEEEDGAGVALDEAAEDHGWESASVGAPSDGDGADAWQSGSVDSGDGPGRIAQSSVDGDSEDGSDDASDSPGLSGRPAKRPKASTTTTLPQATRQQSKSTFLPSLSVGFVRGDSDSDWSDGEADAADSSQRKNRRGQRARKAIWEKKFGKNANHLKKQREQGQALAPGWGPGRGRGRGAIARRGVSGGTASVRGAPESVPRAHSLDRHASAPREPPHSRGGRGTILRVGAFPGKSRMAAEEKPLHPSWEAKRRLKEKQTPAIIPSQGTRLKFD